MSALKKHITKYVVETVLALQYFVVEYLNVQLQMTNYPCFCYTSEFDSVVNVALHFPFSVTTSTAVGEGVKKMKKLSNGPSEERESMA